VKIRKRLTGDDRRRKILKIRLAPSELEQIQRAAAAAEETVSRWSRMRLLAGAHTPRPHDPS